MCRFLLTLVILNGSNSTKFCQPRFPQFWKMDKKVQFLLILVLFATIVLYISSRAPRIGLKLWRGEPDRNSLTNCVSVAALVQRFGQTAAPRTNQSLEEL